MRRAAALALLLLAAGLAVLRAQERGATPPAAPPAEAAPALWHQAGQCGACHVESSWRKLTAPPRERFDHASTGFPLRGAHGEANCDDCHRRGLAGLAQACGRCHADPHAGQNTLGCEQCHTEVDWQVPRNAFDHERTRFPLLGVHAALECEACHRGMRMEPPATAPTECIVCHAGDYAEAVARSGFDHQIGPPFGPDCPRCHDNVIPPLTFDGATIR